MSASKRTRISSAQWWRAVGQNFDNVAREFIKRALAAGKAETGHECGHEFVITVSSRLHISGAGDHADADWSDTYEPVTVRAHNLRDALLVAATRPFGDWFAEGEDHPDE